MGSMFLILAFFTALGLIMPVVNVVTPFTTTYSPSEALGTTNIFSAISCTTSTGTGAGNISCAAGINGPGSSFTTVFTFGNFYAALQYLVNLCIAVILPGYYVLQWLGGPSNGTALGIATVVQALTALAYGNEFFYIVSGRWIFPP